MSKIILTPTEEEFCNSGNGEAINKIYKLGDKEISGTISHYSVGPLRILTHVLKKEKIDFKVLKNSGDLWKIKQIILDDKYAEFVELALKEIMEYRCADELGNGFVEIIRQLPFKQLMETSDLIMNYGIKSEKQKKRDELARELAWDKHNSLNRSIGLNKINIEYKEPIIISPEEPEKRKHLIYTSARGGYNIKTMEFYDKTKDHFCYRDSNKWD